MKTATTPETTPEELHDLARQMGHGFAASIWSGDKTAVCHWGENGDNGDKSAVSRWSDDIDIYIDQIRENFATRFYDGEMHKLAESGELKCWLHFTRLSERSRAFYRGFLIGVEEALEEIGARVWLHNYKGGK